MKVKKLIKMVDGWTGALKVNVQTFCDEGVVYLDAEKCRTCGEPLPEAGDGWDGECGNCADRRVNNG
jgi:hypothetical protein